MDATCAPSDIRFPQDVSLLNEARENAEQIIDTLQEQSVEEKPRTYRNKAHKDSLKYMRSRKHNVKKTREAIRKQLQYLRRDLSIVDSMLQSGQKLSQKQQLRLETLRKIYEQQKYMYDNHTHSVPDRIVSVSQPFIRPIVRGKAGKRVEFGAKLDRKINRIQFLSGNSLKVIAVLTMLIDHLCKIVLQWLLSNYWGAMADNGQMSWERFREIDYFIRFDLQSIGTIAFPLFCFLLAEGFQHTRSKKRYIGLMLAFALISEVPFDIGFFNAYSRMEGTFPFYLKYQNVFFTLFLGLLTLVCLERFSCKSDLPVDRIKSAVLQVLSVVLFSGIAEGIHCDYGMQGILFISAFYICRNHRIYQVLLFLLAYMGTTGNQPPLCTLLACLLILLYNGKRGKLKLKYFFYVFYPAHILVLYLIQVGLGKYLLK